MLPILFSFILKFLLQTLNFCFCSLKLSHHVRKKMLCYGNLP
ncbi:hypothetical protein GLYMA_07G014251v4 [Glycine max]|nr:hypothetical protein GLYMA_07G014251v4 [Glycine max]KAH1084846.1 hypothetical protein GYH30_017077 [Glycine max]